MPQLLISSNAETLLTIGTLSNIESAKAILELSFSDLIVTSAGVLNALVRAVNWSKEHSVAALVDKVLDSGHEVEEPRSEDIQIPEPEMLCFCLHALMDLLSLCSDKLSTVIASSVALSTECADGDLATVTTLVELLLRLLGTEAVHKDALTSAAIILCSLVSHSHTDFGAIALQLASLIGCAKDDEISASSQLWSHSVPLLTMGPVAGRFPIDPLSLPPFARQALIRAVLCSRSRGLVTTCLAGGNCGDGGDGDGASLLFMRAYARICEAVAEAGDLFVVCYALQTLSSCLDTAVAALRAALRGEGGAGVTGRVVERMFDVGVAAVWGHCEDPFQGIADQTKEALPRLIVLRELGQVPAAGRPDHGLGVDTRGPAGRLTRLRVRQTHSSGTDQYGRRADERSDGGLPAGFPAGACRRR